MSDLEDREQHVVVVDEEEKLFLAQWKFGRHSQNDILHLSLQ